MNRLGLAAGAAVMAATMVAVGPVSPAHALAVPPPPTVTASVAAALAGDGVGAGAAAAAALEVGGVSAGSATLTGSVATAGAQGAVVTGGLIIGTYLGQQTLKVLPGDWYTTTGSTWCDLQVLVKGDAACGHLAPAPTYTINSDLSLHAPGWTGTNQVTTQYSFGGMGPGAKFDVTSAPSYHGSGSVQVALTTVAASPASTSGIYNFYAQWRIIYADGSVGTFALQLPETRTYSPIPVGATVSSTRAVSSPAFDHIEVKDYGTSGAVVGAWYPVGNPARPPDADPDPVRHIVTSWTCSNGAAGSATSLPYHESDATWPAWPAASCSTGIVTHYEVSKVTENGPTTRLITWDAPQAAKDWASARPECTAGGCVLRLYRVDPSTGSRLDCMVNAQACVDWYSDPAKSDHYSCEYGGQAVALSECNLFRPTFNVLTGVPTVDNDGKPWPATEIGPYGDPKADGNPVPKVSPDPTPEPSDDGCPPPFSFTAGGLGYWVTKGTACALSWAFVPGSDSTSLTRVRTAIDALPPVRFSADVGHLFDGLTVPVASCEGPGIRWDLLGQTIYPFNSCTPPLDTVAAWSRRLGTVFVVLFGSMAVLRALGSGLGWKPSAGGDS